MSKVLNIVPYPFLPYFSGGQKLIAHFNEYLGKECELHVAGTADNDASAVKHYEFHPLLSKSRIRYANPFLIFKIGSFLKKEGIKTVIIEHPYYGWLAYSLKKLYGARIIVHTHNVESQRFKTIGKSWWRLLEWYEGWTLRFADKIFCITEEDRQWMIDRMNVGASKCIIVPYGITQQSAPADKREAKDRVCKRHKLDPAAPLLFFNGLLDYKPNLDALDTIIQNINPALQEAGLSYNILVAGKRLPASYNELKEYNSDHLYYAGFVDDIDEYTKAADVLLNPVLIGGGVKTKMIEALGLNTKVVATKSGAIGVDTNACGNQLLVVADGDWKNFAATVVKAVHENNSSIPASFYDTYYWGSVVKKVQTYLAD